MAGGFHAVSAVGARMLQETLANGAAAAATRIAEDYGVARGQVQDDLAVFLRDLQKQGLPVNAIVGVAGPWVRRARCSGLPSARRIDFCGPLISGPAPCWDGPASPSPCSAGRQPLRPGRRRMRTFRPDKRGGATQKLSRRSTGPCALPLPAIPSPWRAKNAALCSWSLARVAGLDASLIVGIELFPMAGHCWCEVAARPLGDDQDRCDRFTPWAGGRTADRELPRTGGGVP